MIDAEYIRKYAADTYVKKARQRGDAELAIPVKNLEAELRKAGLKTGRTPLICSALRGNKFQRENGVSLDHWDGPPSGQSTTVVFHFRLNATPVERAHRQVDDPGQRALRLTEKLRGIMKDEIVSRGGAEGFLRWVRSEERDIA